MIVDEGPTSKEQDTASVRTITTTTTATTSGNKNTSRVLAGTAVVCLTDPDADWFQGYLFVSGTTPHISTSTTYYGLLGRIQELDECLQCADGGYRELTLQVNAMGGPTTIHKDTNPSAAETFQFSNIAWTGGDMMRLRSSRGTAVASTTTAATTNDAPSVRMDAERVETGRPAYQCIQAMFGSLVRRLRQHATKEQQLGSSHDEVDPGSNLKHESVADLMPNAAVVTGRMELRILCNGPPT